MLITGWWIVTVYRVIIPHAILRGVNTFHGELPARKFLIPARGDALQGSFLSHKEEKNLFVNEISVFSFRLESKPPIEFYGLRHKSRFFISSSSSSFGGLDRANERFPVVWKSVGV